MLPAATCVLGAALMGSSAVGGRPLQGQSEVIELSLPYLSADFGIRDEGEDEQLKDADKDRDRERHHHRTGLERVPWTPHF